MDRVIEKKQGISRAFTMKAIPYWLGAFVLLFVVYLLAKGNQKTLRADAKSITLSEVKKGEFKDYIRINAQVQPMVTIQLSPMEGGVVEQILIEEGPQTRRGVPHTL